MKRCSIPSPVQVHPFAFHPDVRLVDPPRIVSCLEPFTQAPLQRRRIALYPPPERDVIGRNPAFGRSTVAPSNNAPLLFSNCAAILIVLLTRLSLGFSGSRV